MVIMHRFNRNRNFVSNNDNNNNDDQEVPIRTLYFAPVKPFIVNKINGYFEQYGEVDCVRFHVKDDFKYGFVQYKMAKSAEAVLANRSHRIANCYFKVKPADLWHQPDYGKKPVYPIPEQDSDLHILIALNDDCLREVFGYLGIIDLSNAAEVCVRFNQQAKESFASKYKNLDIDHFQSDELITRYQIDSLLQNFGSMIRSLKIDASVLDSEIPFLCIASQYLTALEQLELSNFYINTQIKEICSLFGHVEKLQLNCCELNNDTKDLYCLELKTLILNNCDMGSGELIKHKFVKLEEAHMSECYHFDQDTVIDFIEKNPTLTKLSIVSNDNWTSAEPIDSIGRHLNRLVELEIDEEMCHIDGTHFQSLGQLHALKILKLNFNTLPTIPLLKCLVENKVSIEDLKVYNGYVNCEAIKYISQMNQIKKLELIENDGVFTDEHLIQLAKGLPQLNELRLKEPPNEITSIGLKQMLAHAQKLSLLQLESVYSITIDVNDYKAMLKTVKNRPEKVNLLIKITSDGDKVEVDETMLAENREILFIDEEIEDESYDFTEDSMFEEDDWYSDDDFWYHDSDADSEDGHGYGLINGNIFSIW